MSASRRKVRMQINPRSTLSHTERPFVIIFLPVEFNLGELNTSSVNVFPIRITEHVYFCQNISKTELGQLSRPQECCWAEPFIVGRDKTSGWTEVVGFMNAMYHKVVCLNFSLELYIARKLIQRSSKQIFLLKSKIDFYHCLNSLLQFYGRKWQNL